MATGLDATTETHLLGNVTFAGEGIGSLWYGTLVLSCESGDIWLEYTSTSGGGDDLETEKFEFRDTLPVDIVVGQGMPDSMLGGV